MAEHWMEILRPGTWNEWDFSPQYLRDLQASYDPAVREAPITIGHPDFFDEEKPAYGWVKKLEIRKVADAETDDDISVWALVDLNEEAEGYIREKKFPKRSAGISETSPYPGIPYLKHIALLGATNPAVSSLTEVELSQGFKNEEGILCLAQKAVNDISLVWESKEQEYWYRIRPPSRFRSDTFRSFDFKGVSGLRAVGAKYKPEYIPEGNDPDSMVIQALRFDKSNFSLAEAKAWVKTHKKELSLMTEGTISLTTPGATKELAVIEKELDAAKAKNDTLNAELQKERDKAKEAEGKLKLIELSRKETEYEHELTKLVDEGKGIPAYTEFGLHKALTAMDAAGVMVLVKEDTDPVTASSIILKVLKALPKVLEHREVAGSGKTGEEIVSGPLDTRFDRAMQSYKAEGKSVVGEEIKILAEKLMKEDPKLDIRKATLEASRIIGGK